MKKVAFVYGNFNIFHPGHLRLLKFAKESSDYLIVGVNSDKLSDNPNLLEEEIRLESIKATSYVDEVFLLDDSVNDMSFDLKQENIVGHIINIDLLS